MMGGAQERKARVSDSRGWGHLIRAKRMSFYQVGVPAFGQFAAWCPTGVFDMNTTGYDAHDMDFR